MGAAGRERVVDSLAWEHQAPKYVAVYRELLDGARLQLVPSVVAERGARAA